VNPDAPQLSGDKGLDAVTLAGAFVSERCRVIGWQQWYHDMTTGRAEYLDVTIDIGPRPNGC